jgi:hypothetical protein
MKYNGDISDNDLFKDIGLLKYKLFKDLNILIAFYKVKKRYHVDAYKYDIDKEEFLFVDGVFKSFSKKQYKVAKWYYSLLVDQYSRGLKIYGIPAIKQSHNGL